MREGAYVIRVIHPFFISTPGEKKMLQKVVVEDFLKLNYPVIPNTHFELQNIDFYGSMSVGMTANTNDIIGMMKDFIISSKKKSGANK
jgi:hypothetical protein